MDYINLLVNNKKNKSKKISKNFVYKERLEYMDIYDNILKKKMIKINNEKNGVDDNLDSLIENLVETTLLLLVKRYNLKNRYTQDDINIKYSK